LSGAACVETLAAMARGSAAVRSGAALVLLSILKLVFVAVHTVVIAPIVVALALVVDERFAYRLCLVWVRVNLRVCGVRVHARRLAPLAPGSPYVFMSNHRSQFDILAVASVLGDFQLRWVAKKELLRVPAFGWALRHTGHIIIDRGDTAQAVASLRAARAKMQAGISVMIFPEGTRARPGQDLLPFKKGGFMLALDAGVPVVPIVVRGSAAVLPRDSWLPRGGDIEVVVGTPIPVAGVTRDELMRHVAAFMHEQLGLPAEARGDRAVAAEAV
jgi:1-acyl-sn-glycerol-3-phosphate acyltransferase